MPLDERQAELRTDKSLLFCRVHIHAPSAKVPLRQESLGPQRTWPIGCLTVRAAERAWDMKMRATAWKLGPEAGMDPDAVLAGGAELREDVQGVLREHVARPTHVPTPADAAARPCSPDARSPALLLSSGQRTRGARSDSARRVKDGAHPVNGALSRVVFGREAASESSRRIPPPQAHTTRSSTALDLFPSAARLSSFPHHLPHSPPTLSSLLHHILPRYTRNIGSPSLQHTHTPPWTLSDHLCNPSSAAEAVRQ